MEGSRLAMLKSVVTYSMLLTRVKVMKRIVITVDYVPLAPGKLCNVV